MIKRDKHVSAMLVQKHQLDQSENKLSELDNALNALLQNQETNNDILDQALADLDIMLVTQDINPFLAENIDITQDLLNLENSIAHLQTKLACVTQNLG